MIKKVYEENYNELSGIKTEVLHRFDINDDTGETIERHKKNTIIYGEHYWRLYPKEFIAAVARLTNLAGSCVGVFQLFCLLFEKAKTEDNICHYTQEQLARASGFSRQTIVKYIRILERADVFKMIGQGQYMLSPYIIVYHLGAGDRHRDVLIKQYECGSQAKNCIIENFDKDTDEDLPREHFWRLYRKKFIKANTYLTKIAGSCIGVFELILLMFDNTTPGSNICYCTQEQLSQGCKFSRQTIVKYIDMLVKADVVRMIGEGQYMLSPYIMVFNLKEGNLHRNILIRQYENEGQVKKRKSKMSVRNTNILDNIRERERKKLEKKVVV